ncbi:MAG: hypothetical protein JST67_06265 [Bacteroidetes bacterium]|nr:hypothetical protein [Bacteroidota bacterium]
MIIRFLFLSFLLSAHSFFAQTKTYASLSKYEKCWAWKHPFASFKIKKQQAQMYAVYTEVKQQHLLDTFENGGTLDAFRHSFAMAYFSRFVKVKKLQKLGVAHEKANHWQFLHHLPDEAGELPDSLSSVMDLKNNAKALSLANEVKNMSVATLKQKIISLIQEGFFFIIKRNEQGLYVTCQNQIIAPNALLLWNSPKCLVESHYKHKK